MATQSRKRPRTGPSPVRPDTKTLFHFFAKPNLNNPSIREASPTKRESDLASLDDEPTCRPDGGLCTAPYVSVKTETTPSKIFTDEIESQFMEFEASFTEANGSCSPLKEEQDDHYLFEGLDLPEDGYQDEGFHDNEFDSPYESVDDIEDNINEPTLIRQEPVHPSNDDDPSCPFCNFSFKGLSEQVLAPTDIC